MTVLVTQARDLPTVRDGDIIFQTSRSAQSLAVQQATGSRYSHMGIIALREGKPYVFEAAATVKYTPLSAWIDRGEKKHFVVKRLKNSGQILTPAAQLKIRKQAQLFAGKPYDPLFSWSDENLYCSELVWKIYDRALGIQIGKLQKVSEFHLNAPAVKQKLRERYGTLIPWNESVISPKAMFESPQLITVISN
ncbi:YiiX family permuted papain-like enzyme [Serratia sp. L9]|uniref:YiiX family permuted papain-like enzyme n=1 Tax=Serratia sp. L9 TaxID=3423946 RepID=UPI003D66793B